MNAPLPPLPQLRSFVAVVAHGRLNRAAEALNLTESAVSHHLRRLEDTLGVRLLERGRAETVLTEAGERFHPRARDALRLLEEAVQDVTGQTSGRVLLTMPRAMATHWLVPRFPRLHAGNEDLELQLLPTARPCDLEREQIDLGIRLGGGEWRGLEAQPLLLERTCPLATPALAGQWREQGWSAMAPRARLIANATHPDEWNHWCHATGRDLPREHRATTLESFDLVLQAGLAGSGLIMGRTPMVHDAIARGDLVAPFPEWATGTRRYYIVWPVRRPPNRHAPAVVDWLVACAADTAEYLASEAEGSAERR